MVLALREVYRKEHSAVHNLFRPREATRHALSAPLDALVPPQLATATFGVG